MADQNVPVTANGSVVIRCDDDQGSTNECISFQHDSGAELMRIQEDGKVGIGTDAPDAKLTINQNGSGWDDGIRIKYGGHYWDIVKGTNAGSDKLWIGYNKGTVMVMHSNGNVGIGTTNPGHKLDVDGDINTSGDIRKNGTAYNNPDYVFGNEYSVMPLNELKSFVGEKRHLPNMPSTEDVKKEGVKLFEQNRLLLEKLEEAYLYIFQLEERMSELEKKS
jgi:hypothetical protein